MYAAHAGADRLQRERQRLVHQPLQPILGRHQVGLVPVRLPHHLPHSPDSQRRAWNTRLQLITHSACAAQLDKKTTALCALLVLRCRLRDTLCPAVPTNRPKQHNSREMLCRTSCIRVRPRQTSRKAHVRQSISHSADLLHMVQLEVALQRQPLHGALQALRGEGATDVSSIIRGLRSPSTQPLS